MIKFCSSAIELYSQVIAKDHCLLSKREGAPGPIVPAARQGSCYGIFVIPSNMPFALLIPADRRASDVR